MVISGAPARFLKRVGKKGIGAAVPILFYFAPPPPPQLIFESSLPTLGVVLMGGQNSSLPTQITNVKREYYAAVNSNAISFRNNYTVTIFILKNI